MLLPKLEPHVPLGRLLGRLLNVPRRRIRPAEVDPNVRLQAALQPADVPPVQDPVPHGGEQAPEIGSPEVRPRPQLRERVLGRAHAVEVDVGRSVEVEPLREVGVDAQELRARARPGRGVLRLLLQAR